MRHEPVVLVAAVAGEGDLEDGRVRRAGQALEDAEARERQLTSPRAGHANVYRPVSWSYIGLRLCIGTEDGTSVPGSTPST